MSKELIETGVEEFEEMYEFHEEYATKEKAEDIARCDGFKDYRIIKGCSCWHYLYNTD